jgi:hypothetical protein
MFCSNCGAHAQDGDHFCNSCGDSLQTTGGVAHSAPPPLQDAAPKSGRRASASKPQDPYKDQIAQLKLQLKELKLDLKTINSSCSSISCSLNASCCHCSRRRPSGNTSSKVARGRLDNPAKGCYDTAANHPQYVHEGNSGSGGQTPHMYGRGTPPHLW